ncbi:MAG TPA: hypothetical protein DCY94_05330 [Firmicutes bacterium]|nr:hypothetical protein [Bacillota bacterium]
MKVLVVPTWYPSGEDKLMGIYHKEFTSALNKYGVEADMLYIDRERLSKPFKYLTMKKREVVQEENYKVYIHKMLNLRPINFDLQMMSYVHKFKRAFKNYMRKNGKPDVIHACVSVPAGYAAVKVGMKYDIPVVVQEHGGDLERLYKNKPWAKYGKYVLEHATMSTVSKYMKKVVEKYTDKECYVIPNQVDTTLFKNDKKRKLGDVLHLISVCALREGKRLDVAFEAIKQLIDEGMKIDYKIIGDGFYEDIYKASAKENGIEEYVEFLGRKSKEELPKYLLEADALLITSELESFAIPAVEAQASALPVITTACMGPTEFIDRRSGAIAKVNDVDDVVRAIKEVVECYPRYYKKYMESVADKFSEENVVKTAKEVYKVAIENNKKNEKQKKD